MNRPAPISPAFRARIIEAAQQRLLVKNIDLARYLILDGHDTAYTRPMGLIILDVVNDHLALEREMGMDNNAEQVVVDALSWRIADAEDGTFPVTRFVNGKPTPMATFATKAEADRYIEVALID